MEIEQFVNLCLPICIFFPVEIVPYFFFFFKKNYELKKQE